MQFVQQYKCVHTQIYTSDNKRIYLNRRCVINKSKKSERLTLKSPQNTPVQSVDYYDELGRCFRLC